MAADGMAGSGLSFPTGGGQLGELIRAFDWASTSLGPIEQWPQSLKSVTGMLLLSPVPIVLLWGEDGVMIYNDAYSVFAGNRHPQLLGSKVREGWAEVADFNDNVMRVGLSGGTLAYRDQELTLIRNGRPEPVWMNLDYSPVLDENGKPAGVIAIVVETTQNVIAERRLRESENRFRALTLATSDAVYRLSADWVEMRQLDGRGFLANLYRPSARWTEEYLLPEDRPEIGAAIARAIRTRRPFQMEHRIRKADGSVGWVLSRAVPVADGNGEIVEWFGAASDVTERRRADARREALIRLTREIQSLWDAEEIALAAARIIGETLEASRAGYGTVDEALASFTIVKAWNAAGITDVREKLNLRLLPGLVQDVLNDRIAVVNDVLEDPRVQPAIEHLLSRSARALVNVGIVEKGRIVAVFFVNSATVRHWSGEDTDFIREVASRAHTAIERVRAEHALQTLASSLEAEVEQRTRERDRIWRNTQDLSVVLDRQGTFHSVNPAVKTLLGWSQDEVIGRHIFDFIIPEDHEATRKTFAVNLTGHFPPFENRYRHKDGSHRWISWVAGAEGDLIYGSGRDVTAEKEAATALAASEEALRQAQKMEAVGQLTGGLAHDFNNILAGISGSLELILLRLTQGRISDAEKYVGAAQGATKRAAALTHRLLAFSRRQTLDPRPTDPNALVSSMEELIRRSVGPEISVETRLQADLWHTLVDPGQLENALLNLSINARDAMVGGGRLVIRTANQQLSGQAAAERNLKPGDYVVLSVSDNGTGMTPDVASRAFDPFFTTKPIGQGTGLGLSMIYGFARQSGGHALIVTQPGQGTEVFIYLPRHGTSAPAADAPAAPEKVSFAKGAGETVLVVDDEPLVRVLITEVLEELGYRALEAGEAAEALPHLESEKRIDLMVTDVGLPNGINGRQLADAARTLRPGLKILFITGYAENAMLNQNNLEPGMHVMTKPFAMDALANRIRQLIGD
ncbi:PAS domain S-box protein [Rhizobium sp. CSW-27]|uniref:PAS domain S-box protein n=1 Tax=Rhizobium sp. CSW-27 TaxID=2839985 RepID=UPI001C00D8BC|nr:PAS domain S-box protein [Rhizobium sp. CSW-27]MBT9371613.1 PAS domain S-box protein [Rhizobium sp. CSW-27]